MAGFSAAYSANEGVDRVGKNRVIFREIEQDNHFITQQIATKYHSLKLKVRGCIINESCVTVPQQIKKLKCTPKVTLRYLFTIC